MIMVSELILKVEAAGSCMEGGERRLSDFCLLATPPYSATAVVIDLSPRSIGCPHKAKEAVTSTSQ